MEKIETELEVWKFLYHDIQQETAAKFFDSWWYYGICDALAYMTALDMISSDLFNSCRKIIKALPERLFAPDECGNDYLGGVRGVRGLRLRQEVLEYLSEGKEIGDDFHPELK